MSRPQVNFNLTSKSLTMVWLAKWIRENRPEARVLITTDRTELDEQIEKVFTGVSETICRTTSGADLIDKLNGTEESLLCSLVHKFSGKGNGEQDGDEGTKASSSPYRNYRPASAPSGKTDRWPTRGC